MLLLTFLFHYFFLLSLVKAQQCGTSSDCTSPSAPHCSRWGWCQWTPDYGSSGPSSDQNPSGSCRSAEECPPRAPHCSNQGYCTPWQTGETKTKTQNLRVAAAARVQDQFLKSQMNHFVMEDEVTNNFKRSPGGRVTERNSRNQIQRNNQKTLEPIPAVPDQTTKSSRQLPQTFSASAAVPVPGIQRRVQTTTTHSDYYDYYDYDYYAEFEVLKEPERTTQKSEQTQSTNRQSVSNRGQFNVNRRKVSETVGRGKTDSDMSGSVSQGCLVDCVTDCVSIKELTAYRDCVEFCGRTCNTK